MAARFFRSFAARLVPAVLFVTLLGWSSVGLAQPAQPSSPPPLPDREWVIGTKEAPPFAMKAADGTWQGISIELWRRLADELHLRYRFVEKDSVQALVDATASGDVDAGVAALTVTADRQRVMDFTQPFYATGLGVAVQREGATRWLPILRAFFSFSFLQAVLVLLGVALSVGVLIWLFERKHNEHFSGPTHRGLVSGVWWSAVAMTQAGAAQNSPTSLPGRLLAVVWMVASIIALAVFTAGITSALTTHQLQGLVRNLGDLRGLNVGSVQGSSTEGFLTTQRIRQRLFPDPQTGLRMLQRGQLDAFVYDKPLLEWLVRQDFGSLEVLAVTFDRQNYAISLPSGSPLRVPLDIALLDALRSEWWQQTQFRYLGQTQDERPAR